MLHVSPVLPDDELNMKSVSGYSKEEMRALAVKCPYGVTCIETGKCAERNMCSIERSVGENILFIKDDGTAFSCPYKVGFGFSHFCSCPVRGRLHRDQQAVGRTSCHSCVDAIAALQAK